jgi:hypothetical protein
VLDKHANMAHIDVMVKLNNAASVLEKQGDV